MRNKSESDLSYVEFALEIIDKIRTSTLELTKKGLLNDELYVDLMAFYIAQVGEQFAPDKLSEEILSKFHFSESERSEIYKMRNKLDHHYGDKDDQEILFVVEHDIPNLKLRLETIRDYLLTQVEEL